ncbi:MAG: hypothetical protein HYV52_03380 [Parcubacteria group bacterium]|nr:hypothetical protein [Parcubacteria group bacterium]
MINTILNPWLALGAFGIFLIFGIILSAWLREKALRQYIIKIICPSCKAEVNFLTWSLNDPKIKICQTCAEKEYKKIKEER